MRRRALLLLAAAALAAAAPAGVVAAETFPAKPIRFVVPFPPAGAVDLLARALGEKMTEAWGQPVIVDNKPGAGSTIGTDAVAKAPPDGHTILLAVTAHAINATLYSKLPYDPVKDFAPVALVATAPNVLVANPALPANTVQELIALAKAKPNELNFGSPGSGTSQHLAGELFNKMAGLQVVHVPYKGTMPVLTDLLRGEVAYTFDPAVSINYVREGRLEALAVTGTKRSPALPDVPTVAESGLPGYEAIAWYAVLAPAGTPRDVVATLNAALVRIEDMPEIRGRIANIGLEPATSTPEELRSLIEAEVTKWAEVVRLSGARAD